MIYWDNNATTQPDPRVVQAMLPYLQELFFNPSAAYTSAKQVRYDIENARKQVASLLGVPADEIIFTSGATEATCTALHAVGKVLTLPTEHSATLHTLGERAILCPVKPSGTADTAAWASLLPECEMASFAPVNHETGVIQPMAELCAAAEAAGKPVHLDLVQSAGKIPLKLHELPAVTYATLAAHKLHGPKGVGALYVRCGALLQPLLSGGGQESGRRSGTENVPGIIGFGKAAQLAAQIPAYPPPCAADLRTRFLERLRANGIDAVVNGAEAPRVAHVLNLRVPGCNAESLQILLEKNGLLCSAGAACTGAHPEAGYVLRAMGLSNAQARESLRLSWNRHCTGNETDAAAAIFSACVKKLKQVQSSSTGTVTIYAP